MEDDTNMDTTVPGDATVSESQTESESQAALSDPGKKALSEERRRAANAEKAAKALQAKLDALEAEKLTREEKAVKEAAEAASRAARAEQEAMRLRYAIKYGADDTDASLFLTGTDDETLTRQGERYRELMEAVSRTSKGTHVPGVGNQPNLPPSLAEQIVVAEQAGDQHLAMQLKTQQLAELARAQQ